MDLGLLLLRLVVGGLIFGHGAQKGFGLFGGMGPAGTAPIFESWGLRPGKPLVLIAATCELVGSTLLILGLGTPLGAAMAMGTLIVAASVNAGNGLWAVKGGYELPLLYAVTAGSFAFIGPGRYSIDHLIGLTDAYGVVSGAIAVAAAVVSAAAFVARARHTRTHAVAA
ncbi:putative oxidoreductase [Nocardioides albertanoniae]|uniref:Putative oxidoreductase n=1 Tax=Nocardioides albertanoniae TaxID=1175486 RepID=A0A543A5Q6_9ACTN|nr:DoxX family protein [Nocardioides albertanoniae]TQL67915.1 putative oxidoreductase [Nocardioides albertanoniae]